MPPHGKTPTRDRFVAAASQLFQQQGFEATTVQQIARQGRAPIGSLYYYFPGGKEELGSAAVAYGAAEFGEVLRQGLAGGTTPSAALSGCAELLAQRLEATGWIDGCPVATVALETVQRSHELQAAAGAALEGWVALVADHLRALGVAPARAKALASTTIALLEGAELMARVLASREPLERAAVHLAELGREAPA
jgi:TetR/AcrR family transcriptional repressor of lmrAB and yxaGH operons